MSDQRTRPDAAGSGAEPPVLDLQAFARTSAYLDPGKLVTYLEGLADKSDQLLRGLGSMDVARPDPAVVEVAHALGGSAAMLGFERLAAAAASFEYAVQTRSAEVAWHAERLAAAVELSLSEIKRLARSSAEA